MNPRLKRANKKDIGVKRNPPDFIAAVISLDLEKAKTYLEIDGDCISQLDMRKNNAAHICIGGGSFRTKSILKFLIEETDIDLLHKNIEGLTPLELAIAINDEHGIDLLERATHDQLTSTFGNKGGPDLDVV